MCGITLRSRRIRVGCGIWLDRRMTRVRWGRGSREYRTVVVDRWMVELTYVGQAF